MDHQKGHVGFGDRVCHGSPRGSYRKFFYTFRTSPCPLYFPSDSRPKENSDKPDRFPYDINALVHDCSVVSPAGGLGASHKRLACHRHLWRSRKRKCAKPARMT
ncbi:hypothetical protein BDR07DRAFT_1000625 [Suillus spraguei]|nr:hypothetical protein BDR07DRAFT_1000625 [Suillus spraguei]